MNGEVHHIDEKGGDGKNVRLISCYERAPSEENNITQSIRRKYCTCKESEVSSGCTEMWWPFAHCVSCGKTKSTEGKGVKSGEKTQDTRQHYPRPRKE